MMASARRSAEVTGLPSAFEATSQPRSYSSITAGPAANVAFARNKAISSGVWESMPKGSERQRTELKMAPLFPIDSCERGDRLLTPVNAV